MNKEEKQMIKRREKKKKPNEASNFQIRQLFIFIFLDARHGTINTPQTRFIDIFQLSLSLFIYLFIILIFFSSC
jgi:hypothetical protein